MQIKENYNKLREIFQSRQTPLLIGFGGFIIIMLFILPKTKRVNNTLYPTTEVNDKHTDGGIDALRANLGKLKKEASFNSYESSYEKMEEAKEVLTKTEEEVRQELLGAVKPEDQLDFEIRGENPSVQEHDQEEFIRYIKEQVQYALGAEDRNYKAIVFKGLESSAG